MLAQDVGVARQLVRQAHIGVSLCQLIECVLAQGRRDPRRVPEADGVLARGDQTLQQMIDRQITGRHCQHGLPAARNGADQLHQGGGLTGAGRSMQNDHIFSRQGKSDRLVLRSVEFGGIGKRQGHRLKDRVLLPDQHISQHRQPIAFCAAGGFQGLPLSLP